MTHDQRTLQLSGAFIIDENLVNALAAIGAAFLGRDVELSVRTTDNQTVKGTVADVLNDLVVKTRTIKRIDISGRDSPPASFSVQLANDDGPVTVRLTGTPQTCTAAVEDIRRTLDANAEWYSRFILPGWWRRFLATVAAFVAIAAGLTVAQGHFAAVPALTSYEVASLSFAVVFVFVGTRRFLFPYLLFDIGISSRRIGHVRWMRNLLGIAIITWIIVKVVASLL